MADLRRLVELGMVPPLAKEVAAQITSGVGNSRRLAELSMVPRLAGELATQITAKVGNARRLAELTMVPVLAREVSDQIGTSVLGAMSQAKAAIEQNSRDVNIVVAGDSLQNANNEFIYLWFEWLSTRYPQLSFIYYPSNDAGAYSAPVTLSSGSGSFSVRLYNNSVSGVKSWYLLGSLFAGAFLTPSRDWDFIIWSYGKNNLSLGMQSLVQGEFMASISQFQLAFPNANHVVIDQYPNRDDSTMILAHNSWVDIVSNEPKISLIDFYNQTYSFSDYADNVHLTGAANSSKLLPIMQNFWNSTRSGVFSAATPWLLQSATNLLNGTSNEAYADFNLDGNGTIPGSANVTPAGFTLSGTMTFTKETSNVYPGKSRAQKMTPTGAAASRITRTLSTANFNAVKGQRCVFTVLQYIESGSTGTVGRIGIAANGGSGIAVNSKSLAEAQGGWRVSCIGPFLVAADATNVQATLHADTSASPDLTHSVINQSASLVLGSLPRATS